MELTTLAATFYTLGIILMSLIVILMIIIVVIIFYIKHRVNMIQKMIEDKIRDVTTRPQEMAFDLGASLMSRLFGSKKRK